MSFLSTPIWACLLLKDYLMAFIQVQLYFKELWKGYRLIFQKLLVDWMTFNTLSQLPERLLKYGFKLNRTKCKFLQSSVVYLGHLIDSAGLHPTMDKLEAVWDAPPPKDAVALK